MNDTLQKQLYEKYPLTLGTRDSCLAQRGIECGDGWYDVLDEMFGKIEAILSQLNQREVHGALRLSQIKEKFARLTIYNSTSIPEIAQAVRDAEVRANTTCESCGGPGELRTGGWMKIECDSCVARNAIENILRGIDLEKDIQMGKRHEWSTKIVKVFAMDDDWYKDATQRLLRTFEVKRPKPEKQEN